MWTAAIKDTQTEEERQAVQQKLGELPDVTALERRVLVELARPLASGDASAEPASDHAMSTTLDLDEGDVAAHLEHLMAKFGIADGPARRTRLADEAVKRGAIEAADLSGSARTD